MTIIKYSNKSINHDYVRDLLYEQMVKTPPLSISKLSKEMGIAFLTLHSFLENDKEPRLSTMLRILSWLEKVKEDVSKKG